MNIRKMRGILAVCVLILLCGCGESEKTKKSGEEKAEEAGEEAKKEIDVDLTKLSSTMVYSEVFQMMTEPQNYIGKRIRMKGQFAVSQADPEIAAVDYYFAVIIADATACCQQGMEFIWDGHDSPEDFPGEGTDLTVTGIFETYEEGDSTYCRLVAEDVQAA
ncbi:MAG: hypothetical protein Q4D55_09140 [Eubacteriales bacterium]|nr:hypothetical protein [Eubacteriales bacterium]